MPLTLTPLTPASLTLAPLSGGSLSLAPLVSLLIYPTPTLFPSATLFPFTGLNLVPLVPS